MRDLFVTLADRLKLAGRAVGQWRHAAILRWIDRYLRTQGQERVYTTLDFEELPVLFEEASIPVLFEEPGGFGENLWPKQPNPIDYGSLDVL